MTDLIFDIAGELECPHCEECDWRLRNDGYIQCAECGERHPNVAWYDDDEDVIAQLNDPV